MGMTEQLLADYWDMTSPSDRLETIQRWIARCHVNGNTLEALLYVLDDENSTPIRLAIVAFLHDAKPLEAIPRLTKAMFDADPRIRAQAANTVAEYDDARLLAAALPALFDAIPDPATRSAAERAIRCVTGRPADRISTSERERVRLGEHPQSLWPDHFADIPPLPVGFSK